MAKTANTSSAAPAHDDPPKPGKLRSPNYPVIDLGKALEKAKLLHDSYRVMPVSVGTAAVKMGFKPESSIGGQTIAALRSFGLAQTEGSGVSRKIRISEDGAKMLLGHPSRAALLKTAALMPRIHRELWDKFYEGKAEPDPEDAIKHYLQWDREEGKFNPESIVPLLSQFKRTISVANLSSSDTIPASSAIAEDAEKPSDSMQTTASPPIDPAAPLRPGIKQESWSLGSGDILVRWPGKLTPAEVEEVSDWLEMLKKKIKRFAEAE